MKKSNFQMETPSLKRVEFQVNDNFERPDDGISLDISDAKDVKKLSDNSAYVSYAVKVFDRELKPEMPFFVEIAYGAEFKWSDLESAEVDVLLNQNAPAILLGYIRPLVSQLTGNSGFPPLHLPLLNYQEERK